jgi:uncharacterized membrane protein
MVYNLPLIGSIVFTTLAFILLAFSTWLTGKDAPSDTQLKNARNLQIASIVFLLISVAMGMIGLFRPNAGQESYSRLSTSVRSL